jgi:hypothetical protein
VEDVHEECRVGYQKELSVFGKRRYEKEFYEKLIQGQFRSKEHPKITHLLAGATLHSSNESLCEGMGSEAASHSTGRASLEPVKLSKETFLSWNGPPPTKQGFSCFPHVGFVGIPENLGKQLLKSS